jgi:hypothetical protein
MVTAQQWKNSGLIPTSGLLAWHMFESGVSGHEVIADYSGNGRIIDTPLVNAPVLTLDVLNGQPGWYFNGATTTPLNWTGSITPKHVFVLASAEETAFTNFRGLLTGETSGEILVSENTGDEFFDFGYGAGYEYRKNDAIFAEAAQEAPVGGDFALLEVSATGGFALDGIQVGKQTNVAGRIWKGFFVEQLLFNRVLTLAERKRVMLYFNIKFAMFKLGLPFYFPSDDLLDFKRSRFYTEPPRYQDITDNYEFEDRGRTFNEVADTPPRKWEYDYLRRTPAQTVIFDAFWDAARIVHPFIFLDKYGTEWTDVRIESYSRQHEKHMSWKNDVEFKLVRFP